MTQDFDCSSICCVQWIWWEGPIHARSGTTFKGHWDRDLFSHESIATLAVASSLELHSLPSSLGRSSWCDPSALILDTNHVLLILSRDPLSLYRLLIFSSLDNKIFIWDASVIILIVLLDSSNVLLPSEAPSCSSHVSALERVSHIHESLPICLDRDHLSHSLVLVMERVNDLFEWLKIISKERMSRVRQFLEFCNPLLYALCSFVKVMSSQLGSSHFWHFCP